MSRPGGRKREEGRRGSTYLPLDERVDGRLYFGKHFLPVELAGDLVHRDGWFALIVCDDGPRLGGGGREGRKEGGREGGKVRGRPR